MSGISVVGSVNLDLVVTAARLPMPGETLTDGTFIQHPGGKGANQALAARRLGADVALTARVGADTMRERALALLQDGGVNLEAVTVDPEAPTGVAVIIVGSDGENQIVVAPGANRRLAPEHVDVGDADAVICQLEIPIDTVAEAARQCRGMFCLNAAPARSLPAALVQQADLVIVNETEWRALGKVLDQYRGLIVLTKGAAGATAYRDGGEIVSVDAPRVETVDTVGAGDTFVAALVVSLLDGDSLPAALSFSCRAGALATTVIGAQPSLPTRAQMEDFFGD